MRQHDAGAADANARRRRRDRRHQHFGRRADDAVAVVMLGYPVAVVSERFAVPRELERFADRDRSARRLPRPSTDRAPRASRHGVEASSSSSPARDRSCRRRRARRTRSTRAGDRPRRQDVVDAPADVALAHVAPRRPPREQPRRCRDQRAADIDEVRRRAGGRTARAPRAAGR